MEAANSSVVSAVSVGVCKEEHMICNIETMGTAGILGYDMVQHFRKLSNASRIEGKAVDMEEGLLAVRGHIRRHVCSWIMGREAAGIIPQTLP